eukprot:351760-Chlamydomonas_euryale.AAC.2
MAHSTWQMSHGTVHSMLHEWRRTAQHGMTRHSVEWRRMAGSRFTHAGGVRGVARSGHVNACAGMDQDHASRLWHASICRMPMLAAWPRHTPRARHPRVPAPGFPASKKPGQQMHPASSPACRKNTASHARKSKLMAVRSVVPAVPHALAHSLPTRAPEYSARFHAPIFSGVLGARGEAEGGSGACARREKGLQT